MIRWILYINGALAAWVIIDGLKRKAHTLPWAALMLALGPYILPLYIIERPLKAGEPRPTRTVMNILKTLGAFWCILTFICGVWKSGLISHAPTESEPLEYKLSILDTKKPVSESDDTTSRFHSLLEGLSDTYGDSEQQIANISVAVRKSLISAGIKESLLNIMEGMNRLSQYGNLNNKQYADLAAEYVTLRMEGQVHDAAVEELEAKLRGY